ERIQKLADEETNTDGGYVFVNDERQSITVAKNMLLTVDIFSYGFIALISLIAAANVFNTVSTAFLLRRREFAVLSSVGMTPKEMNRMLSFECLLYGLKALLYGIPVSLDRKSTRLNSSHVSISYAVFCLKKKKKKTVCSIIQCKTS